MILAFRHRGLKRLYEDGEAAKLIPEHVDRIRRILAALDSAQTPQDMGTRTCALHRLKGERKGGMGHCGARQLAHHVSVQGRQRH